MTNRRSDDRHDAAYSATGRRKARLAWLPWAALLLLLVLAGIVFLIARNAGDDSDDAGIDVVDDAATGDDDSVGLDGQDAGEGDVDDGDITGSSDDASTSNADADTPSTNASNDDVSAGTTANAPAPAASAAGSNPTASATPTAGGDAGGGAAPAGGAPLVAGDQPILPLPADGLAPLAGQAVTGTAVPVESVVADEGFWGGTSPTDRVFVVLTPEARTTQGESPFQVQAGQSINLAGTLIPLPGDPETLGVDPDEGAEQLLQQGHVVEATSIALT